MKHPSKALAEYYLAHDILPVQTIEYMEYALHSILDELTKLIIYTILFAFLGKLPQYFFILVVLLPIRWAAGGLHSKTFWGCFSYSLLMFLGLIYIAPLLPHSPPILFAIPLVLAAASLPHVPYTPAFRPITNGRKIRILRIFYITAVYLWIAVLCFADLPEAYVASGFYTLLFQVAQLFIPKKRRL